MRAVDADLLRPLVRGRWLAVLGRLAPALEPALAKPGRHIACPVHGGRDGFRLFKDAAVSGGGICNTCGARPDGFALLMWLNCWNFNQAAEAVGATLGITGTTPPRVPSLPRLPVVPAPRKDAEVRAALRQVWAQSLHIAHPQAVPARRYLARRGLRSDLDPRVTRLHPRLGYYDEARRLQGHYPALISRFCAADGRPVGLHRTWLTDDGHKAPVAQPKKLMAAVAGLTGGAVRLCPPGQWLGIAEGLETALAAHQTFGWPAVGGHHRGAAGALAAAAGGGADRYLRRSGPQWPR